MPQILLKFQESWSKVGHAVREMATVNSVTFSYKQKYTVTTSSWSNCQNTSQCQGKCYANCTPMVCQEILALHQKNTFVQHQRMPITKGNNSRTGVGRNFAT